MLNFYNFFNKRELYKDELYYDPLFNLNKVWMPDLNCQYSNIHHIIKKDPYLTYRYSRNILGGRWPEGEPTILLDVDMTFFYMTDVIKGTWIKGSKVIKKDPQLATWYAHRILKRRWKIAEPYIKESETWCEEYCKLFKISKRSLG